MVLTLEKAKNNLIKAQKESARAYKNVEKASVVYNKLLHKQIGGDQAMETYHAKIHARYMYNFIDNENNTDYISRKPYKELINCEYIGEDKSAIILIRKKKVRRGLYNAVIVKYDAVGENFENENRFGNYYTSNIKLYNVYPVPNTTLTKNLLRGIQPRYNSTPIIGIGLTIRNGFDQDAFKSILSRFLGNDPMINSLIPKELNINNSIPENNVPENNVPENNVPEENEYYGGKKRSSLTKKRKSLTKNKKI